MKIQLFNPPVRHYQQIAYAINPPLGPAILCALLRDAGHICEVVDLEALGVAPERFGALLMANADQVPDVIGFSVLTSSVRGAADCIAAARRAGYTGRVVVGGVHATIEPQACLDMGADTVVTGECEGNICQVIADGLEGIVTGLPCPIEEVPAPAWEYHTPKPNLYGGNAPHLLGPEGITMWTRGCPYECTFCGNAIFSPTAKRCRPVEAIVKEVQQLRLYNVRSLFVYDDELLGVRLPDGWLHDLCDALAPMGFLWKTQGRCSRRHVTPEVMSDVYRAGCRVVMWGCETFSDRILRTLGKGTQAVDNWHALRTSRAAGVNNFIFSMVGNAEETEEDLAITCKALGEAYREGLVQYRQTTVVTALPHTKLWRRQQAEGWYEAIPTDGPQMAQVYRDTPWITGERLHYWLQRFAEACPVGLEGPL